jgi:hypothetical protein
MTKLVHWLVPAMMAALAGCGGGSDPAEGDDGKQTLPPADNPQYSTLTGIWAFSDKDVWAVGSRVLHFDGSAWKEVDGPGASNPGVGLGLTAVWGLAPDDLWVTSGTQIYRYRGASTGWVEVMHNIPNPPDFNALFVLAEDDYAVGGGDVNSEVIRVKGTTITRSFTSASATTGIWGASGDDIWAAADFGGLYHWDGAMWSQATLTGNGTYPHAVWGASANDVWAVGDQQTLQHWDGSTWTETATEESYGCVWGAATGDVWAAGDGGIVSHYDGESWTTDTVGSSLTSGVFFTSMSGSGPSSVWASGYELGVDGNNGVIYRLK